MSIDLEKLARDTVLINKVGRAIQSSLSHTRGTEVISGDYGFQPEAKAAIQIVIDHIVSHVTELMVRSSEQR